MQELPEKPEASSEVGQPNTEVNEYVLPILVQQIDLTFLCFIQELGSLPSLQSALPVRYPVILNYES